MSIKKGMGKEGVVYVCIYIYVCICVCIHTHTHIGKYNGILLSHKEEQNWVMCRDVDGPKDCHTE